MPASRSANRNVSSTAPAARRHSFWPLLLIGVLAALLMLIVALPASLVARLLPPNVRAEDMSGTVWHGVAGKLVVGGIDAGAVEWRLHPAALLHLALDADVHWVKLGLALDADAEIGRGAWRATAVRGGGPIADLHAAGVAAGWRGIASVDLTRLAGNFSAGNFAPIASIMGAIRVSNLASPQVAGGASLGGYVLRFDAAAVDDRGAVTAHVSDIGGPLQLQATLTASPREHRGLVSGTLAARAGAAPELRALVDNLARARGRDAQGRVPVDVEITF